jgi:hypothetical protein
MYRSKSVILLEHLKKNVRVYFGPVLLYVRNNIALLEGFKVSSLCPVSESISEIKMSTEHWWKNTERGNLKYSEGNIP